jgi:lactoylglutathione lyase
MKLALNLLVLRCKDVEATRRFYELLGAVFSKERHGKGPEHYACENSGFVLELYPTAAEPQPKNSSISVNTFW